MYARNASSTTRNCGRGSPLIRRSEVVRRRPSGVQWKAPALRPHRLAEFEFRYNTRKLTDMERSILAVRGGEGKRLTYHQPH